MILAAMPPKRNTLHMRRPDGRTACGRLGHTYTANTLPRRQFVGAARIAGTVICKQCRRIYESDGLHRLVPGQ